MMDMESLKQYLSNVYENYLSDAKRGVHPEYTAKCMGAMEAMLVVLGVLSPGVPHVFNKIDRVFNLFWLIPINYKGTETYFEKILRLTEETLNPAK